MLLAFLRSRGPVVGLLLCVPVSAQSLFASSVASFTQGSGGGVFLTSNILGGPQGGGAAAGATHVCSLGIGGQITLGFEVTIVDGPGADFSAFENGFLAGGGCFAETAQVEVSSDGIAFARFPSHYAGPAGPLPPFGSVALGAFSGLVGGSPVFANVATNSISPFDPVVSGGESFDLAELASDPLVQSGSVDLGAIHFVRLLDCVAGTTLDSSGAPIWDNGGASSADIDAVAVIQHAAAQSAHAPRCDLELLPNGKLRWTLGDPDGLGDLDFASLHAALNQSALPVTALVGPLAFVSVAPDQVVLESIAPIAGTGILALLAISVRDLAGTLSGDQVALQG